MGGLPGTGSGKGDSSTPSSNAESALARELFYETKPGRKELEAQGLEALQTGGVGSSIPMIQRVVESSKSSMSNALKSISDSLATSGLAGSPFAEGIKANSKIAGELQTNKDANAVGQWFMQMLPNFLTANQSTGAQLLGNAAGVEGSLTGTNTSAAKGLQGQIVPKINCCFIFLEAEGYPLHPIVRRYRDEFITPKLRRGYCILSDKFVPKMQKSKWFKGLIRLTMTQPLTMYGKYHYGLNRYGFIFKPIKSFWFSMFNIYGNSLPYVCKSTKELI